MIAIVGLYRDAQATARYLGLREGRDWQHVGRAADVRGLDVSDVRYVHGAKNLPDIDEIHALLNRILARRWGA